MIPYLFCLILASGKPFCVPRPNLEDCMQLKQETEELAWREGREVPHLQCRLPATVLIKRGQFVDLQKEYQSNAD